MSCEPVAGLRHGLVQPAPEGPGQDERRRRRVAAERQTHDQAADLRDAEGHEEPTGGAPPPLAVFSVDPQAGQERERQHGEGDVSAPAMGQLRWSSWSWTTPAGT